MWKGDSGDQKTLILLWSYIIQSRYENQPVCVRYSNQVTKL